MLNFTDLFDRMEIKKQGTLIVGITISNQTIQNQI